MLPETWSASPPTRSSRANPDTAEQCVALTEEDLATLEPTDDKTIHLEHFLSPTEFDLTLLAGRSLYLCAGPSGGLLPSARVSDPAETPDRRSPGLVRTAGKSGDLRSGPWLGRRPASSPPSPAARTNWPSAGPSFSSKRQLVIVYPAEEVLLVQPLFDLAQRRAVMPVDQDAVQIDRKEIEPHTLDRIHGQAIRWQELWDDTDARLAQLVEAKLRSPTARRRSGTASRR